MAEGRFFEPFHVPQQSRRDKLRVISSSSSSSPHNQFPLQFQGCSIFDPSLVPPDLITCVSGPGLHHHQNPDAKDGGSASNYMGYGIGGGLLIGASSSSSTSSATTNHLYMDPVSSVQLNPSPIQAISGGNNGGPFYYNPQTTQSNLRFLEQSFHGGSEVMVFRTEPLSVGHATNSEHTPNNNSSSNNKCGGGGQGLSLSLSSHHSQVQQTSLPLELNLQRYDSSSIYNSTSNELLCSRSSVPLGPFTGYASILRGSRFLKPAQQLLEEICDLGRGVYAEKMVELGEDSVMLDSSLDCFGGNDDDSRSCRNGVENETRKKKSRLISMLNEVYKRYKQYYQQMQAVISSFESVPGVRNAAPFASLALKAMSKHFRCLKDAIIEQLQMMIESRGHISNDKAPAGLENSGSGIHYPRPPQNSGLMEHNQPVWRPQRGLPERAVAVLRSWLFDHFLHPYPTDTDKIMLAKQTGLSRNQVSNWFINARVRLWKPMVEEIHTLETRQGEKGSQKGQADQISDGQQQNDHPPQVPPGSSVAITSENASTLTKRCRDQLGSKRTRNDLIAIPSGNENVMNLCYQSSSPSFVAKTAGNGGVSLTLGLYQNNNSSNNLGFPDPYPMNAARRFGLDGSGEGYAAGGGVIALNRQFGREVVGGGQLLHDFVG